MRAVFSLIQSLGYKGTFEIFFEIEEKVFNKWREYREKKRIELSSTVWWREILEHLNLEFTSADITQLIIASHLKWRSQIALYTGVQELLMDLQTNYKLACISNISEGDLAREDMNHFGILNFFDCIVMSSDLGIRKPAPKIFRHVLKQLNLKKEEMIYIGDTLYDDIKGAKAAGLLMAIHIKRDRSYFFPDYYITPDRTIYDLSEISDLLHSIT
jgi:putative hydrolase of the HAD superfamily